MLSNTNISNIEKIITPDTIINKYPASERVKNNILKWRQEISDIIQKKSNKLLIVVGPCSIHDPHAAYEYATQLKELINKYKDNLFIVMRVYFEKPRTTVGWKGLINDPHLDNSYKINDGLDLARKLLLEISKLDVPVGCEFLDTISPQYISDLVSWGAIGARTTESQVHRELASGLSMPIGFKNGTSGSIDIAVDAIISAKSPHVFLGVSECGKASIVHTKGNKDSHIILRGGKGSTNYSPEHINITGDLLFKKNVIQSIMVDCSHGNSQKIHTNQIKVAKSIANQIINGENRIAGCMIESNINEGNQKLIDSKSLLYGVSITDACINLVTTDEILNILSNSKKKNYKTENHKRLKLGDIHGGINYLI